MTTHDTVPPVTIDRREAVRRVSLMLGGLALFRGDALWDRLSAPRPASGTPVGDFTAADVALLDEVADTILPTTARSPGAKAAQTGAFMALMVTDAYEPPDQQAFRDGMATLDAASRAMHGTGFMTASPAQRLALLESLDREAHTAPHAPNGRPHYFRMMKELACLGFFTSEIGCTQAQRYVESPGRFDGCAPYKPGDRAWAPHA